MLKTLVLLFIFCMIAIPASANETMNVQDIMDVEPALPFGGDFFSMIFALLKWGAIAGFISSLFIIIGHGAISSAMDNADMSEKSQNNLFKVAKIIGLGAVVYLLGTYIFTTFL